MVAAISWLPLALYSQVVTFSEPGGFYKESFTLTLSCSNPDAIIHFTTNGNTPTAADPTYDAPLILNESLYSPSHIYTIQSSPDDLWYVPKNIKRCIVIRAAAFTSQGEPIGAVTTNSYFIGALGCDTHGLPVMSLCVDSLDLFDFETGIYVPGAHYDPDNHDFSGNYYQEGREWERPCNVEFYETDNNGINQAAGVRTQGVSTRRFPQKGLKIYARDEYGNKRFKYKFFKDIDLASFKHLKIKSFQGGWIGLGCQDYICGLMARNLDLDCLASRPMVLFLNGEYWGVYFLQEKPDERYLEDHFDADLDRINIISTWGGGYEYGSATSFRALRDWIETHDLASDENYTYVAQQIDISNFIDYQIFEIFSANLDWPANNMRCWQEGDGPWRWIFYDGDACVFRPQNQFDAFANATYTGDGYYPTSAEATLFFRKLMENETFKTRFIRRFNQLMRTSLSYNETKPYYDEIYHLIENEIRHQSERFGNPESLSTWKQKMKRIDKFLEGRVADVNADIFSQLIVENQDIDINEVYYTQQVLHTLIEAEQITKADLLVFDLLGRQVAHASVLLGAGPNNVELPAKINDGIFILKAGDATKRFAVIGE